MNAPHPPPEVQAEMRAQAAAAAAASGHVSLMAFRIYRMHLCVMIVTHDADQGLALLNEHLGTALSMSECSVRAVQRNVDLGEGVHLIAPIKPGGTGDGHHTARTARGKARKRRKARRRAARAEAERTQ